MNNLNPCPDCRLKCAFRGDSLCVCNLVRVHEDHAAISLGQYMGLKHVYGDKGMPPCVHGYAGSAVWSIAPGPSDVSTPQRDMAFGQSRRTAA